MLIVHVKGKKVLSQREKRRKKLLLMGVIFSAEAVLGTDEAMNIINFNGLPPSFYSQRAYAAVQAINIATVTDTSSNAGRTFTLGPSNIKSNSNLLGSAVWATDTPNDPAGGPYAQLTPNSQNQFGYNVLNKSFDATSNFSVTGYFNVNSLNPNTTAAGDWVGLILLPVAPGNIAASQSLGGGGLGISGIPNAYAMGVDMYRNNNYNDPSDGPFAAFRWTGSSGTPQPLGSMSSLYTSSQNLTTWGKTLKYTLNYYYNNGTPYVTGTITDAANASNTFSFNTQTAGLPITLPASNYFTVALDGANGTRYQPMKGSFDTVTATAFSTTATVKYAVDTLPTGYANTAVQAGNTVAPNTTLKSATGDSVGITNVSTNWATDAYSYDGTVPANAASTFLQGWHVSRTQSVAQVPTTTINSDGSTTTTTNTVTSSDLNFMTTTTTSNTNFTLYYLPDLQTARVVTDSSDPNGSTIVDQINGYTGGKITGWTKTDANLARAGYNYTVIGPDGNTYQTLAAAEAATTATNSTFDNTANGSATTDSAPQTFTVKYTKALQQAIVQTTTNGSAPTTLNTYDNTAGSTPTAPLQSPTTNTLVSELSDASLARTGYTYTVTAPNGTTYSSMAAAYAANIAWDTTNNPAGATTDGTPQVWTINYTGLTQTANITQHFNDGSQADSTLTSSTGPSGTKISFPKTDADLAVQGYSYQINVLDGSGNLLGTYSTLTAALQAYPNYDATQYATLTDPSPQTFQAAYTPASVKVTYYYEDTNGNTISPATTNNQSTNTTIDTTSPPTIAGYVFKEVNSSKSDMNMKVNPDGTSVIVYTYQIDPAIIAAANTAINNAQSSAVSNETPVQTAISNLQNVLNSTTATPQDIQNATTSLNNVVASAMTDRTTATSQANTAMTNSNNSVVANDSAVGTARDNLQMMLDNPGQYTTQQIKDATKTLNDTVSSQIVANQAAQNNASSALNNVSPVSNEMAVANAISNLNNVLSNPESSTDDITNATQALTDATNTAKAARDDADTQGTSAITTAQNSSVANDPAVQTAITNLDNIMKLAATDSPDNLTQDIINATNALNQAVTTAQNNQTSAQAIAQNALQNTQPVSNETAVASAISNLNNVLNNPNATADQINTATDQLTAATNAAKAARNSTVTNANTAISNAQSNPMDAADPGVQAAIANLQTIMTAAANDQATTSSGVSSLTKDINAAITALNDALSGADASHNAVTEQANNLLQETAPVSNETAVAVAITALQNALNNPSATTAEITQATNDLQSAVETAKALRDTANTTANQAITSATASDVVKEPSVQQAITNLQTIMAAAANDQATTASGASSLTADINLAIQALNDALTSADSDRNSAEVNANQAIADAGTVYYEPNVYSLITQLQQAMNDPANATTAQINNLTNQLLMTAINQAKAARTSTENSANSLINSVNNSLVADEPAVQAVVTALQNIISKAEAEPNGDSTALTKDIQAAMDNLTAVQQQALSDRSNAVDQANTVLNEVKDPYLANEPSIITAANNLQSVLQNPQSTTQDIVNATNALDDTITAANTARDVAIQNAQNAISTADNSNVANEPDVQYAEQTLNNILKDPTNYTTQQIIDATTALNNTVASAQDARQNALTNAQTAMDASTPLLNDPKVAAANTALQEAITGANAMPPTATTADVTQATQNLNTAINNTVAAHDAAIAAATDLISKTAPVSHEADVAAAVSALNDLIANNPKGTTQAIQAAISNLQDALDTANTLRNQANTAANSVIASIPPDVVTEPGLVAAEQNLQTIMTAAANDQATTGTGNPSLTADIQLATQQLQQAIDDATAAINKANSAVVAANNSNVANEPAVAAAVDHLQQLIADPSTPNQTLIDTANALDQLVQTTQNARQQAIDDATTALMNAAPVASDPDVAAAEENLQDLLDDPSSTIDQITQATNALNSAIVNAANQLLEKTQPISNEPATKQAKTDLENLLNNDPTNISAIAKAAQTLTEAIQTDQTARNTAVTAADTAAETAENSSVANDPNVQQALEKLKKIEAAAANDQAQDSDGDPSLTADILQATQALKAAQDKAQAATAAQNALDNTRPVSHEPAVATAIANLQNLLNDPNSTVASITTATTALENATNDAKNQRTSIINQANILIVTVNNSTISGKQSIIDAINHLKMVITNSYTDDPAALTKDIQAAMAALVTEQNALNTAINNANQAINDAKNSSYSSDSNVQQAIKEVQDKVGGKDDRASDIDQAVAKLRALLGNSSAPVSNESKPIVSTASTNSIINSGQLPQTGDNDKKTIFSAIGALLVGNSLALWILKKRRKKKE